MQRNATRNGNALAQTFSFGYDGWNHLTSVSAGSHTLASYSYANGNGNLTGMTYGNGTAESYTYNSLDQVTALSYNGTVAYRYTYTNNGNIETITDVPNNVVYRYRYDSEGNTLGYTKTTSNGTELQIENWKSSDGLTNGSNLTFNGSTYTINTVSDSQTGNVLSCKLPVGRNLAMTYDSLGQLKTKHNQVFYQNYSYEAAANSNNSNETTGRISGISYTKWSGNSFNEFVLSYEYDLLGNITKVKDGSNNTLAQYTYDAQNQLLSETLPQQNKRYEYTYDTAGNVLSVKTFTATGTTATHTDTYTYGDSSWNDLLTGFNGQSITYDGSGNPLTYNNGTPWTFTWQKGRELASATSGSTSLSFTYDAEGIRDSKTVNGVTHKYTTVDGTIYCDKWGSNTLIFGYDENGRP